MSLEDLDPADLDLSWVTSKSATNGHVKEKADQFWFEQMLHGVSEGSRNESATRLAGRYIGLGMTDAEVLIILEMWNQQNDPALSNDAVSPFANAVHGFGGGHAAGR